MKQRGEDKRESKVKVPNIIWFLVLLEYLSNIACSRFVPLL